MTDICTQGFSPNASGTENQAILQRALDEGGTVLVGQPGVYPLAGTVYIGSHTTLTFANGAILKKVDEKGPFCHVVLNKGALTRRWDCGIAVENLTIQVNGMDNRLFQVYGLHGQLAFFYVKDLRIEHFRCLDLGKLQYGIHICTFEDVVIRDVIIKGDKDGVHFGRGKRFLLSGGIFETYDDAVALNAHDYDVGNPEMGWIEDGVVENCHDTERENGEGVGYFCRILAGAWKDWEKGMMVQRGDTVVSGGRLYRVKAEVDGREYQSLTRPCHSSGEEVLDGIHWVMSQEEVVYTAGVRNVIFRNIFCRKVRTTFSVHFDCGPYSRSYYPGAEVPLQQNLTFDGVQILHGEETSFLDIYTPIDMLKIAGCSLGRSKIRFHTNKAMEDYGRTRILLNGCSFRTETAEALVENHIPGKQVQLVGVGNIAES